MDSLGASYPRKELARELTRITSSANPHLTATTIGLSSKIEPGRLRGVYWRIFLNVFPTGKTRDPKLTDKWENELQKRRQEYVEKRRKVNASQAAEDPDEKKAATPKKKVVFGDSDSSDDEAAEVVTVKSSGGRSTIDNSAMNLDNPFSTAKSSRYAQLFQQRKTESIIDKDLNRLWSDEPYFEDTVVKQQMKTVLLAYCCDNELGYRQGMHEVLSMIFLMLARDAKALTDAAMNDEDSQSSPNSRGGDDDDDDTISLLSVLCNTEYIQHDAYALFERMMTTENDGFNLSAWYQNIEYTSPRTQSPTSAILQTMDPVTTNNGVEESEVVEAAHSIQRGLLREKDEELWKHLNKELQVHPTSYLLRWLRLLFIREFPFNQAALLWDAMLAEYAYLRLDMEDETSLSGGSGRRFHSVNGTYNISGGLGKYIAVAMLVYLREELMEADFAFAMRRLMRYPPVESTVFFIEKAIERRYSGTALSIAAGIDPPPSSTSIDHPLMMESDLVSGQMRSDDDSHHHASDDDNDEGNHHEEEGVLKKSATTGGAMIANTEMKAKQMRIGLRLGSIITRLERKVTALGQDEDDMKLEISELKEVRDALIGKLD